MTKPTVDKLNKLDVRITRIEERMRGEAMARIIAIREIDRRLEGMNELRNQINSERGHFVEREMYDERYTILTADLSNIHAEVTTLKATILAGKRAAGVMVAGATLVLGLVSIIANVLT